MIFAPDDIPSFEWDYDGMESSLNSLFLKPVTIDREVGKVIPILDSLQAPVDELTAKMDKFAQNERVMEIIPKVMLSNIDVGWVKHLEAMAHLKEGIGLRHYQQEDPMRIYQREGLELFGKNFQELRRSIIIEVIDFMKTVEAQLEGQ